MSIIDRKGLSSKKKSIEKGNTDDYELIGRIGCGRYGEVFEAINVTNNKRVAIKVLKPVRQDKVMREMNVLIQLSDGHNIIRLQKYVINNGIPSLIFPFISKDTLRSLGPDLNKEEVPYYLSKLLRAIHYTHSQKIIHRDIKPSNVVIDRNRKILRLIDWGLADFHTDGKVYSVSVASRHYKPPELLCYYNLYDYSLDIWSFGCVMASLIFKREPFFQGNDNLDQLFKICEVLGTKSLKDYVRKYNLNRLSLRTILDSNILRKDWKQFINSENKDFAKEMAIDLVDKLLVFDHKYRLTSNEALSHPFFDSNKN